MSALNLRTAPVLFSSSSGITLLEPGTGDVTGGTDIGILGMLSKSFIWLLGSPSFTRFTLHLGMARTAEANGGGAPSGRSDDLGGDFCNGEFMGSITGSGDDNIPCSELKKSIIELFELETSKIQRSNLIFKLMSF